MPTEALSGPQKSRTSVRAPREAADTGEGAGNDLAMNGGNAVDTFNRSYVTAARRERQAPDQDQDPGRAVCDRVRGEH